MHRRARTRLLVATVVIVVVFVAGVVALVQRQGAYYRQVSELSRGPYDGKAVKVGGRVVAGSIRRDAGGLHFRLLDLTGAPDTVEVVYSGQVPNAFAAGTDVVVLGTYDAGQGLVVADELQTKCPSKYRSQASPAATGQD